jgi:hypothetical protein
LRGTRRRKEERYILSFQSTRLTASTTSSTMVDGIKDKAYAELREAVQDGITAYKIPA